MNRTEATAWDRSRLVGISPDNAWVIPEAQWRNFRELGIRSLRLEFKLSKAGRDVRHFDFSAYDEVVSRAAQEDIEVVMLVDYSSYLARAGEWQMPWGKVLRYTDSQGLLEAMESIVPHFRDRGVHAWEIWNEPNGSWRIEPEEYAGLLCEAYARFKFTSRWDEDAVVILGGLDAVNSPARPDGLNTYARRWFTDFYAAPAMAEFRRQYGRPPMDAVSIHPYMTIGISEQGKVVSNDVLGSLRCNMLDIMDGYGDTGIPVWITEIGSQDPDPHRQAQFLTAFFQAATQEPRITRVHWFKYQWSRRDGTRDGTSGYGIVYSDEDKKEAYYALKREALRLQIAESMTGVCAG